MIITSNTYSLELNGIKYARILDEYRFAQQESERYAQITQREKEVISLAAIGMSNEHIADKLFISRFTVEQHRKNINRKLGLSNVAQLIRYAQAFDLV